MGQVVRGLLPGLGLGGLALGLQASQRRGDPLTAPPRRPPAFAVIARHFITAGPRPEQVIFRGVGLAVAATVSPASLASASSARFADADALAAIFIPSSATTPSLPMPSRAHSISTWAKNSAASPGNPARNCEIVTCRGAFWPQITRNATSLWHSASIRREDVTWCAYAHTSSVTSMSGSYPAVPAPPVLRAAWNTLVSR